MAAPFQTYGYSFVSCKLRVDMSHPKWQKTLRKVLNCIQVYNFNMDDDGTAVVSGRTNPYVLLNTIGKAGKRAELVWIQSGQCSNCLNMPSTAVPPPPTDDYDEDDRYADGDYPIPRGDYPYYTYGDYYGGGPGNHAGYGYEFGNHGGYGYGGWGGYSGCPQPSYDPFGEWAHLLHPFLSTSPGW